MGNEKEGGGTPCAVRFWISMLILDKNQGTTQPLKSGDEGVGRGVGRIRESEGECEGEWRVGE